MIDSSKLGLFVVAGMIGALPLAIGCGNGTISSGSGGSLENTNSRVAYIVTEDPGTTEGDLNDPAEVVGAASATITANGSVANFTTPTNDIHNQENLARNGAYPPPGELYGDSSLVGGNVTHNTILVERIADVDQDGTTDDTFLTFHHNNPVSPQRAEFARGYHGTRSDAAVIEGLQSRTSHTATYTGVGQVSGGQGAFPLELDGTLEMDVTFAGTSTGIDGAINVTTPTGPTNPSGFDQVTFQGAIISGSADYDITNLGIKRAGVDRVTFSQDAGVGSFFGDNAGGTIGVFSGTGQTVDSSPSQVNIIGSFHGSTTDNNPAP